MLLVFRSIIAFYIILITLFFPQISRADNCCSVLTTSYTGYGQSTSFSCESSAQMKKSDCDAKNYTSTYLSTISSFKEGAKCNDQKNECVAFEGTTATQSLDEEKRKLNSSSLEPITFKFNVPLPGLSNTLLIDKTSLPDYIIYVYKFVVGVTGLLAVFMITVGGIIWIFAGGNASKIGQAKQYITGSVVGILLSLGSYSILYIINPSLVANSFPNIPTVKKVELAIMSSSDYFTATGVKLKTGPELIALAKKLAKDFGVEYCVLYTILATESQANPGAIGFDEDVRNASIGSRRTFVNNSCTQTHSGQVVGKCEITGGAINDDRCMINFNKGTCPKGQSYYSQRFKDCKQSDLCLDWRYTRGIGMFQASVWNKCTVGGESTVCVDAGKKKFTPREFLKPENQYEWFANSWNSYYCPKGSSIYSCWVRYAGADNAFVKKKQAVYNDCKKSN